MQCIVFLPLAAELFGGWHEVAEAQVRKLAAALARHNRIPTIPAAPIGGRE